MLAQMLKLGPKGTCAVEVPSPPDTARNGLPGLRGGAGGTGLSGGRHVAARPYGARRSRAASARVSAPASNAPCGRLPSAPWCSWPLTQAAMAEARPCVTACPPAIRRRPSPLTRTCEEAEHKSTFIQHQVASLMHTHQHGVRRQCAVADADAALRATLRKVGDKRVMHPRPRPPA